MLPVLENLYPLNKKHIKPACLVLANAFKEDPIWSRIFHDQMEKLPRAFEFSVRYSLKYGKIYATSENLEGIAVWLPSSKTDFKFFQLLLSGALFSTLRLGSKIGALIGQTFEQIGIDKWENMKDRPYIYLFTIGVGSPYQRQGFGTKLIQPMIEKANNIKLPIYVETETEGDVKFYEKLGFEVIKKINVSHLDIPMWELIKQPQ